MFEQLTDTQTGALIFVFVLLSGIVNVASGVGGAALLLPLVMLVESPQKALTIVTVSQIARNILLVAAIPREVVWPVSGRLAAGGIVGALLGAFLVGKVPEDLLRHLLGAGLVLYVGFEVWRPSPPATVPLTILPGVGFLTGIISALFGTTGTFTAPVLFHYGLVGQQLVATVTAAALITNLTKLGAYASQGWLGTLGWETLAVTVVAVSLGVMIGVRLLKTESPDWFRWLFLGMLTFIGLTYLFGPVRRNPVADVVRERDQLREEFIQTHQ